MKKFDLESLGKFDAIYCDPPWEEYEKRAKAMNIYQNNPEYYKSMTFNEIAELKIDEISDSPSFLFLWVGC